MPRDLASSKTCSSIKLVSKTISPFGLTGGDSFSFLITVIPSILGSIKSNKIKSYPPAVALVKASSPSIADVTIKPAAFNAVSYRERMVGSSSTNKTLIIIF